MPESSHNQISLAPAKVFQGSRAMTFFGGSSGDEVDLQREFAAGIPLDMAWVEIAPKEDREGLINSSYSEEYDDVEVRDHWKFELVNALRKGTLRAIGRSHDHSDQLQTLKATSCHMKYFNFKAEQFNAPNQTLHDVVVVFPGTDRKDELPVQVSPAKAPPDDRVSAWIIINESYSNKRIENGRGRSSFNKLILEAIEYVLIKDGKPIHKLNKEQAMREIRAKMRELFPERFPQGSQSPNPETIRKFLREYGSSWFAL